MINTLDNSTVVTFTTTSDQSSNVFAVPARASQIAWQLIGSPDAISLQLLGSINNISDEFTVIDSSTVAIGELRYVSPAGFRFIKVRQVSRTGASAVNIHFNIIQNGLGPSVVGVPVSAGANKVLFDNGDVQAWSDSPSLRRLHLTDYLNFSGDGSSGYGLRNNSGVIEFKSSDGAWAALGAGGSVTIPGDDTQLLFNDNGSLGADAGLTFDKTKNQLAIDDTTHTTQDALLLVNLVTNQIGFGIDIYAETTTNNKIRGIRSEVGLSNAMGGSFSSAVAFVADYVESSGGGDANDLIAFQSTGVGMVGGIAAQLIGMSLGSNYVNGGGSATENYGLKIENQAAATNNWAIKTGTGLVELGDDLLLSKADSYLNFGTTRGTGGYGLRDNAGTIEIKNSGGSWSSIGGIAGLNYASNTLTLGTVIANQIIQPLGAVDPDQSGVNLILRGGLKTGTGDNGQIHLQTPDEIDSLVIDRFGWVNVSVGLIGPEIDVQGSLYLFGGADNAFFTLDGTAHQLNLTFTGGGAINGLVLDAPIQASGYKSSDASPGVDAGPYTIITSITVKNGLITAIAGS